MKWFMNLSVCERMQCFWPLGQLWGKLQHICKKCNASQIAIKSSKCFIAIRTDLTRVDMVIQLYRLALPQRGILLEITETYAANKVKEAMLWFYRDVQKLAKNVCKTIYTKKTQSFSCSSNKHPSHVRCFNTNTNRKYNITAFCSTVLHLVT